MQPLRRLRFPPHGLADEDRLRTLLAGSLSLTPAEKQRLFEAVPEMRQEQYDRIVMILEAEKTKIDAIGKRGEKIRRLIGSLLIMAALDWAEIEYGFFSMKP